MSPGAKFHTVSRDLKRDPSVHTACCKRGERRKKNKTFLIYDRPQNTKAKPSVKFPFTHSNLAIADEGEVRSVALHDGREAYLQLSPIVTRTFFDEPGLPAPGHKLMVLVHVGDHRVHLLRRIPESTREGGGIQ